jgi:hypothetical protein
MAIALQMIGVNDAGLLFGFAQAERSDEWALWTAYVQIAVNNGFARIEHISPYEADLRNFQRAAAVGLGVWSFKPQMWTFFLLPPAAAFSLMFAILLAACWIGWYLLARELRFFDTRPRSSRSACSRCPTCSYGGRRPARWSRSFRGCCSPASCRCAVAAHSAPGLDHRHVLLLAFLHDLHRLARIRRRGDRARTAPRRAHLATHRHLPRQAARSASA